MGEQRVRVELAERSYDIVIGPRVLAEAGGYITPLTKNKRVIIVADDTVARLYMHRLTTGLEAQGLSYTPLIVPSGEKSKSFELFAALTELVLEQKPTRDTLLLALGGGVIGDLTGFVASVVLRGIDFVQIPTTLLAQVDSSVGGKTAINSRFGKNLVGSFHQPRLVLADTSVLTSLPKREWLAGYAEILKYGLIGNMQFFEWLEKNSQQLLADEEAALTHAIAESCKAKAQIVAADEREGGVRALLNFGHTFGHALEAETGYSDELLHGEAVAIGMMMALEFSAAQGLCPQADVERVRAHYQKVGLPQSPKAIRPEWNIDALMDHFTRDKKATAEGLTFILSKGIGQAFVARNVQQDHLCHYMREVL